jgi:hypothetical protein
MTGRHEILVNTTEIAGELDITDNTLTTIVHITYGTNLQTHSVEGTVNGFHILLITLFASAMIAPEFRKKRSKTHIQITVSKRNQTINIWQDKITRKLI